MAIFEEIDILAKSTIWPKMKRLKDNLVIFRKIESSDFNLAKNRKIEINLAIFENIDTI